MVLTKLINKIIGDPNEKTIKKIQPLVAQINHLEEEYQNTLSLEDIPRKTEEFKNRIQSNEITVDELLPEAFALVKFACSKLVGSAWEVRGNPIIWNMIPYDVQLIGGVVLHGRKIAEMKTGEGKTLVCTLPVYLNALTGKGVHVVTVNEYLAQRDAEWMGGLYRFLGLSVGVIKHGQSPTEKKAAYETDITYGTNNEFGFDYLRDNMVRRIESKVQRGLHYSIVDEVDSILIDEARTPLIISAPAEESTSKYQKYNRLISQLEENVHYNIDEKAKTAVLNEEGIQKMEQLLGVENIYTEAGFEEVHHIEQALKAHTTYKKDVDYMVKDGQVIIVDEFTGRLMEGRRYSQGLHQAIEAKENVEIKRESKTLATITFQNYFRLYEKLAGMTGTAATEAEEFSTIYRLETVVIPTHLPLQRADLPDVIYKNTRGKYNAIAEKVKELHEKGQPVLIGTISVEKSETLSQLLSMSGIKHNVLNAKQHEREAEIVADAGQKGTVTIATNMAGRGTDIKLGEGIQELGGLYVIGTERHESRRIDNQLRGRSGRQGDPGCSQFYVSMEDDLMRLFGSDRVQAVMERLGVPEDMPIASTFISRSLESAQKKVEGRNFDVRKHLVEYDDVMNKHREIMYRKRNQILEEENVSEQILEKIDAEANDIVMSHALLESQEKWNYQEMAETLSTIHKDSAHSISEEDLKKYEQSDDLVRIAQEFLRKEYAEKEKMLPDPELMRRLEKSIALRIIDTLWMNHIDAMSKLRENVALRSYGQRDPLVEYKNEAFEMFVELNKEIQHQIVNTLFKVKVEAIQRQVTPLEVAGEMLKNLKTNESAIENTLNTSSLASPTASSGTSTFSTPLSNDPQVRVVRTNDAPTEKVGRNDPCPCGSGKKYKKCCGAET